MLEVEKRVLFQTRVNSDLLRKFREVQEKQGRTARSMVEDFMHQKIEEDSKRRLRDGNRWHTEL